MADFFECDRSTIENRFSAEIAKGRAALKLKLRRWQLRAAERGNAAVLIWLGKTFLGQREGDADENDTQVNLIIQTTEGPIPARQMPRSSSAGDPHII